MTRGHKIDWTPEMDATLAGMKRAGVKAKLIAARLDVPVTSLNKRAAELGSYVNLNHHRNSRFPKPKRDIRQPGIAEIDEVLLKGA